MTTAGNPDAVHVLSLRRVAWFSIAFVSAASAILSAYSNAHVTAVMLGAAALFAASKAAKPATLVPIKSLEFDAWCAALSGRDPFDPDASPNYEWRGFATTHVLAIRVNNHPTLAGNVLFRFRDELSENEWRALMTRIRHGPHASPRRVSASLGRLLE